MLQDQMRLLFGEAFPSLIRGKRVIDFGCGTGELAIGMAVAGASHVTGVDLQESRLEVARQHAGLLGVSNSCIFATATKEKADIVVSKDAFEHYSDPGAVLGAMHQLLQPGGCVLASFGPTWLHPYGGHLFSVFPWAHLLFTEQCLIRWRSEFKTDGARCFEEVEGGLNRMTVRRFELLVGESPLRLDFLDTVPIRAIRIFKFGILREFGSSLVRCKLVSKELA